MTSYAHLKALGLALLLSSCAPPSPGDADYSNYRLLQLSQELDRDSTLMPFERQFLLIAAQNALREQRCIGVASVRLEEYGFTVRADGATFNHPARLFVVNCENGDKQVYQSAGTSWCGNSLEACIESAASDAAAITKGASEPSARAAPAVQDKAHHKKSDQARGGNAQIPISPEEIDTTGDVEGPPPQPEVATVPPG